MSFPTEPLKEADSAYFVQDRDNLEEVARLEIQDEMITTGMGGVLPELTDHSHLRRVLDVGCGTGDWLMEVARTYPSIEKLLGADISNKILDYAREKAQSQHLGDRVQFKTMDALLALQFPPAFFDLVNQRLGASWIRTWEWTKLFVEYLRVTRPGGIIRITESAIVESNSKALTKLCDLTLETCYFSQRFPIRTSDGVIRRLVPLMRMHGIEDVEVRDYTLAFRAGTREHQSFCNDMAYLFRVSLPFFRKWACVPDDYEGIYEQAKKEMQEPDFVATWQFRTVWGKRPMNSKYLLIRGLR